MYQERSAPVNVGDELNVTIESVGAKGDGIARVNGFVLFVAGTRQGERIKIRVTKVLKNVGFAEVVSREAPSEKQEGAAEAEPAPAEEAPEETQDYGDSETFGED